MKCVYSVTCSCKWKWYPEMDRFDDIQEIKICNKEDIFENIIEIIQQKLKNNIGCEGESQALNKYVDILNDVQKNIKFNQTDTNRSLEKIKINKIGNNKIFIECDFDDAKYRINIMYQELKSPTIYSSLYKDDCLILHS